MGVLSWKELQALNEQRQRGDLADVPDEDWLEGWDRNAPDAQEQYDKRFHDNFIGDKGSADQRMAELAAIQDMNFEPDYTEEDILNSGYGESRFDYKVPFDTWIKDPQNYRSNAQTGAGQLVNGIVKMLPYAISTFLDNTAGLIHGLLHEVVDAVDGDGFTPVNSFIDNPFARSMQNLREWSDKVLPNYRTREEEADADQWWKHLNANFFGDVFLKNLGFTIGAGFSGAAYSRLFRGLQGKTVNNAYKAALAAAEGGKDAEAAFQEVLQGGRAMSPKAIYNTFEKTRKSFSRLNWESQLVGGIGGAIGESRTEALYAAKEFRDSQNYIAMSQYERDKQRLQEELLNNEEYLGLEDVYDGYGNVVGQRPILNEAGRRAYAAGINELQNRHRAAQQQIDDEAEKVANGTFWLNMPLLTASNIVMFGRMMAGGFKTQAKAKVKGNIKKGFGHRGTLAGDIGKGLFNAATEGVEEVSQKIFSEGMKDITNRNMAVFYNSQYDKDAMQDVSSWLMSMMNTAGNVLGEGQTWEEFTIGLLTGALGMPMRGGWSGGIAGALSEGREARERSKAAAEELNKRIATKEFQDLWKGLVRHQKYENFKEAALEHNDSFAWHTANDAEILSDVMMFANAGKLNELEGFVDSFANISDEDVEKLKTSFSDPTNPNTDFKNMTTEQVKAWLQKRAGEVKDTIKQYRDFHDSIDFLSLGTSDEKVINEMIYTQAQLENFERRYNDVLDEVISAIRPTIEQVAQEKKSDGTSTKRAEVAQRLLQNESDMRRLFGGRALDIHGRSQDAVQSSGSIMAEVVDDDRQQKVLEELEAWGTFSDKPELKQKVSDLQKLVRSRQNFYSKLFDPRNRHEYKEKVENDAVDTEDVVEDLSDYAGKVSEYIAKLDSAKTLGEYVRIMRDEIPAIEDPRMQKMFDDELKKNAKLKDFDAKEKSVYDFVSSLREKVDSEAENPSAPSVVKPLEEIAEVLNNMNDLTDIISNTPADGDPIIEVAKELLNGVSGSPKAISLARAMLQEKLGDKAQANNLGVITPVPNGGTGGKDELNPDGTYTNDKGETFKVGDVVVDPKTGKEYTIKSLSNGVVDLEWKDGSATGVSSGTIRRLNGMTVKKGTAPGGGTISQFEHLSELLDEISDLDNEMLNRFSEGDFSKYHDLSDEEKASLSSAATERIEYLKRRLGLIALEDGGTKQLGTDDEEIDEGDPRRVRAHQEFFVMDTGSISGTKYTIYNSKELKKGRVVKYVSTNKGMNATLNWMRSHKVQEFVDSGALAKLEEEYKKQGKQLPIYFVANPHVTEDITDNPFAIPNSSRSSKYKTAINMLLAVEMTDENRELLRRFEEAGFISESAMLDIDGSKYQVIGQVWNPSPKEISSIEDRHPGEGASYNKVKEEANKMWEYGVAGSILPQYRSDIEKGSSASIPTTGKWYVAKTHPITDTQVTDTHPKVDWTTGERLFTTLNYITSGRNETRKEGEKEYRKIPLANSLSEYEKLGGEYYFAIPVKGLEGFKYTSGSPELPSSIDAPLGSLWMATKEANGTWAWTSITILRADEFDWEANKDTNLVHRFNAEVEKLLSPAKAGASRQEHEYDFNRRLAACKALSQMFYLGSGNTFSIMFDEKSNPVVVVGGAACKTREEIIDSLKAGKYRFQVNTEDINDVNAIGDLIDAGVLRSEMRSFIRKGASVGVNFLNDRDSKGNLVTPRPVSLTQQVARTPGAGSSTAYVIGVGDEGISNIRIGDNGYRLNEDGSVTKMTSRLRAGEKVEDRKTIAQVKAIAELLDGTPRDYAGKGWTINRKNMQYTELYEREVDGVTVHMIRRGKNGALLLVYSDQEWDALMSIDEKKPIGSAGNYKSQLSEEAQREQDAKEFDAIRAREERDSKRKRTSSEPADPFSMVDSPGEEKPRRRRKSTVQEYDKEDSENNSKDRCG